MKAGHSRYMIKEYLDSLVDWFCQWLLKMNSMYLLEFDS